MTDEIPEIAAQLTTLRKEVSDIKIILSSPPPAPPAPPAKKAPLKRAASPPEPTSEPPRKQHASEKRKAQLNKLAELQRNKKKRF